MIRMSALTNSTYDGVCYNAGAAAGELAGRFKHLKAMHFDEAWYAYAGFHPLYTGHFGMGLPAQDIPIFCSQSTHKLLTAFSQAAMLHVKLPQKSSPNYIRPERFRDLFNESYMMHGSTSPQYNMVASLEVATKMMQDNGPQVFNDTLEEAVELRKKIVAMQQDQMQKGSWFFGIWQPPCIEEKESDDLIQTPEYWHIKQGDGWHGFEVKGDYAMLDPIKLTFTCPGINIKGEFADTGIPAAIVTNFLISKGIVCEKSDYYSWLLLNSLGTTRGKQGTLVAELLKFKAAYDANALLEEIFPGLVSDYPKHYRGQALKAHCQNMHQRIREGNGKESLLKLMDDAFNKIPEQVLTPARAFQKVVAGEVESLTLEAVNTNGAQFTAGMMIVPYPPGIPIVMGGEALAKAGPALEYLLARQDFENDFPGYQSDIHGIERTEPDQEGKTYFKTYVIDV